MTTTKSKNTTKKDVGEKKLKTSKTATKKKNSTLTASRSQTSTDQKENERERRREEKDQLKTVGENKKTKEEIEKTVDKKKEVPKKEPKELPKEPPKVVEQKVVETPKKKDTRAEEDANKPNEPSGMDVIVKEDDKKAKMDDGYEDFGPGAQN